MKNKSSFRLIGLGLALFIFTAAGLSIPAAEPSGAVFFPEMVTIPAGEFLMGDHYGYVDPNHPSDEIPIHTVRLSAYSIGRYDVTVEQYCDFLNSALAQSLIGCSPFWAKGKLALPLAFYRITAFLMQPKKSARL
jgi:formylglycine-generating enzyme required for sulfatase activity